MAAISAHRVSTTTPVDDLARRTRAAVARHGGVVLIGRRAQARQLRRLQAALRVDGHQAHYFTGAGGRHLLSVEPPGPPARAVAWWGLDW